ncbi:MAG: alginate export family protein [Planctomycetes bacterium]|nr:alginate export family protein [Planctomycetota bacterium]
MVGRRLAIPVVLLVMGWAGVPGTVSAASPDLDDSVQKAGEPDAGIVTLSNSEMVAPASAACAPSCGPKEACAAQQGCGDATCDSGCDGLLDRLLTPADGLKNIPVDFGLEILEGSTLSYGGQLRLRLMDEADRIRPGGPARSAYELWRWRNWLDFRVRDVAGIYIEMIDASQFGEEVPVTPIDVNRWDIQNFYLDVSLLKRDNKPVTLRMGRMTLDYGSYRFLSALDWANTRRNFEGFQLMSPGDTWDIDGFIAQPVNTAMFWNPAALGGESPVSRFSDRADRADHTRTLSGLYTVYKGIENHLFDLYWLWLETDNAFDAATGAGSVGGDRHTFAIRWRTDPKIYDECGQVRMAWHFEAEGGFQVGEDNRTIGGVTARRDVQAGFFTTTINVAFPQVMWKPKLQFMYWWGSGDDDPTDNVDQTLSTLWSFAHFYWGIIDHFNGQNLSNISLQCNLKPTDKLTLVTQMHWFDLSSNSDVLYNVAGVPIGTAGTGGEAGEELDLIATYALRKNLKIQLGYSWFWYGSYVTNNPGLNRPDARQFYLQTVWNY